MPNTFKKEGEEVTEPAECSQRFAHQSSDEQSVLHWLRLSSVLSCLGGTGLSIKPEDFGHRQQQKSKS